MTRINATPPAQPPSEPERPHKRTKHPKTQAVPSSSSSHAAKMRRFAKIQGVPARVRLSPDIPSPIRHQWNANQGYCGEACMVAALMMFGGYMSQFTARQLAAGVGTPDAQTTCQLLLGVNDQSAATQMGLSSEAPSDDQAANGASFLKWVRSEISQGRPVLIGVYENASVFHQKDEQSDYDHIVTVTNITDTTITFHDNGLYGPPQQDTFTVPLKDFLQTRSGADSSSAPIYSLCSNGPCYGLAITGPSTSTTLPVSVVASSPDEPKMGNHSNDPPTGVSMTLTPTVSGLTPGKSYTLYRYSDPTDTNPQDAVKYTFQATSATMTLPPQTINSNDTAIFRCVPN